MREFYLFTKTPIAYNDCEAKILAEVKKSRPYGEGLGFCGDRKNFWTLELENEGVYTWAICDEQRDVLREMEQHIPFENPYVNYFGCHRSVDAKRLFAVLMQIYPELFINVDDSSDWYGTAQEYIDTEFDY